MKNFLICSLVYCLLYSCSPKIVSKIITNQQPLNDSEFVLVLQPKDEFINDGIEIGAIKEGDMGLSVNCTYSEVINDLKKLARNKGANVIKLTKRIEPDQRSTCVGLKAKIYKVPDFRKHEKIIEWSENRKLTPADFKGTPSADHSPKVVALTHSQIQANSNHVTLFNKAKIFSTSEFHCDLSWIRPEFKDNLDILAHEQGHFNITEIYRRKLNKRLMEVKLTSFNIKKNMQTIFSDLFKDYDTFQNTYDNETIHGTNSMQQKNWEKMIASDLIRLSEYKN